MELFLDNVKNTISQFPGHIETIICKPSNENDPEYRVLTKFDSLKHYRIWEMSSERESLAKEGNEITEEPPQFKIMTGLETWFSSSIDTSIKPPPKHKMIVVIWLCIFPLVTSVNFLLQPYAQEWSSMYKSFIISLIVVPIMTYIGMPIMRRIFKNWLYPNTDER